MFFCVGWEVGTKPGVGWAPVCWRKRGRLGRIRQRLQGSGFHGVRTPKHLVENKGGGRPCYFCVLPGDERAREYKTSSRASISVASKQSLWFSTFKIQHILGAFSDGYQMPRRGKWRWRFPSCLSFLHGGQFATTKD